MDKRFMALRIVGSIFKILAWITLVIGLLVAAFMLVAGFALSDRLGIVSLDVGGPLAGITAFIVALIATVVNFLILYAFGEAVYLFLSIEENTRRTAYIMQQQHVAQQTTYSPSPAQSPPPEQSSFPEKSPPPEQSPALAQSLPPEPPAPEVYSEE
jgi:hypothetical protein